MQIRQDLRLVNDAFFSMVVNVMSFDHRLSFGDCAARAHNLANGPVDDLTVSVYDRSGSGMEISYDVNPDLYGAGAEKDIARRLRNVINWLTEASPGDWAGRAEVVDAAERARILHAWNDTAAPAPAGLVPERFLEQAAACPDAAAVVSGDGAVVSYAELAVRAARLGWYLRLAGAGAETVIGL